MNTLERKKHWEHVFKSKDTTTVSWYQKEPRTSLALIKEIKLPQTASIIEVGSGDSYLGDYLTDNGFSDIHLLDISEAALEVIKNRLKDKAPKVNYIAGDVCQFCQEDKFDLWHDRAVFHFLSGTHEVKSYINNLSKSLKAGGYFIISTFSDSGPEMCSGLPIRRYSQKQLCTLFEQHFKPVKCFDENHKTPSGSIQNFSICVFQKK